jgi:uncharacterized SAM-dependent methyltransferase
MYIGSRIGNFSSEESRTILRNLRSELRPGDALLLGTDMVKDGKDEATLVRAYDDSQGVTAAFNLNILHRLNRELGANFDTGCFRHRARWNRVESRIEMHLESARDQCVNIPAIGGLGDHSYREQLQVHPENARRLVGGCGFGIERTWTDPQQWYALTLASLQ